MTKRSWFFTFEGIDGVGKSTQQELFVEWLRGRGLDVATCRDPGSTPLGETLRGLLLRRDTVPIGHRAELLLYMAARAQLVDDTIRPALKAGTTMVCDRFIWSTLAYQVHAYDLDLDAARKIAAFTVDGCLPDLVFLLDLDPAVAAARRAAPNDRIEARGLDYLSRVRDGFLIEARRDPDRIAVIDASGDPMAVQEQIRQAARQVMEAI